MQIDKDELLPFESQNAIKEYIVENQKELYAKILESNWRLTQHNFISNAGGAVAILGYMGSSDPGRWAVYPLLLFAFGIVSSTVEVRALLSIYTSLHQATSEVLNHIMSRNFSLNDTRPDEKASKIAGNINKYAGYISQASFILGILVGGYFYVVAP